MFKTLTKSYISLFVILFSTNALSEDLIPAEYFACYSNSNSMQMSPDGKYIAIVSQPRAPKCDIEPDLQKYVEDDYRGGRLTLYNTANGSATTLTSGVGNSSVSGVSWVSNDRIIFNTSPTNSSAKSIDAYALWGMNIDGSKKKKLFTLKQIQGTFASPRLTSLLPDEPNYVMVAINDRRGSVEDYYRLNIFTGSKKRVAMGPDIDNEEALFDVIEKNDGTPLAAIGNLADEWRIWRYYDAEDTWDVHFTSKCQTPTFFPLRSSYIGLNLNFLILFMSPSFN